MKYYRCKRPVAHYCYCDDIYELKPNFTCRFGIGKSGVCGSPFYPPVPSLPPGTDKKRVIPLDQAQVRRVPAPAPSPTLPPAPAPSLSPPSSPSLSPFTVPSSSFVPPPMMPAPAPSQTYLYRCLESSGRHCWRSSEPVGRPADVLCPGKTFGKLCDKPLEEFHGTAFFVAELPLPLRRHSDMPSFVFTAPRRSPSMEFVPVKAEARSQEELTRILTESGEVTFLCRNGEFAEPSFHTPYVAEPGVTKHGPLRLKSEERHLIGRNEVSGYRGEDFTVNPFIKGTVTYPDFVVRQRSSVFAIELKTPRTATMGEYLRGAFYTEARSRDAGAPFEMRAVEVEITARGALLPDEWLQMLAFDLFNLAEEFTASVAAIQEDIREGSHRSFWQIIGSFLFIDRAGKVLTFSKDTLLEVATRQRTLRMDQTPSLSISTTSAKRQRQDACAICGKAADLVPGTDICGECVGYL